jgi:AcrR family transcriptional regulator
MASTRTRRPPNQRSDVRAAAVALFAERGYRSTGMRDIAEALDIGTTSVYSHISSKAELLHEITLSTIDAIITTQADAIASSDDVEQQLRRVVESMVRHFTRYPQESIVATRDFVWAEGDNRDEILARRQRLRHGIEDILERGAAQGRFVVESSKMAAFAIIEMCEAVPTWFRDGGELSDARVAYLYGEYAIRIAGTGTAGVVA